MPFDAIGPHDAEAGAKTTPSKISSWPIDEIFCLNHLLGQAAEISIAINRCYWRMGILYRWFRKVRCDTLKEF